MVGEVQCYCGVLFVSRSDHIWAIKSGHELSCAWFFARFVCPLPSDFLALALGQKPAKARCQKPGQAWANIWLRVAYGSGFRFGKPITWALASAPVLAGHGPRQANSREPGVKKISFFFLTSALAVHYDLFHFSPPTTWHLFAAPDVLLRCTRHVRLEYKNGPPPFLPS